MSQLKQRRVVNELSKGLQPSDSLVANFGAGNLSRYSSNFSNNPPVQYNFGNLQRYRMQLTKNSVTSPLLDEQRRWDSAQNLESDGRPMTLAKGPIQGEDCLSPAEGESDLVKNL